MIGVEIKFSIIVWSFYNKYIGLFAIEKRDPNWQLCAINLARLNGKNCVKILDNNFCRFTDACYLELLSLPDTYSPPFSLNGGIETK